MRSGLWFRQRGVWRPTWLLLLAIAVCLSGLAVPVAAQAQSATVHAATAVPLTWTGVAADRPRGVLEAVDCPTTTECVAVDDAGDALVETAGVWSRPVVVAPASFVGLSCPSTTFCVAIGLNFVSTFNGKTWTVPQVIDATPVPSLWSVSCPSTTFCKAINAHGYVFTYNGSSWSAPVLIDTIQTDSISCPSTTMCMATDALGGISRWDGRTWQPATSVLDAETPGLTVEQVDCPTTTFCEATSPDSTTTWNGTSWSARAALVTAPDLLDNLSCSAAGSCAALDLNNSIWTTSNGRTWTKRANDGFLPTRPDVSPVRGLSCPTATSCTAVGTVDAQLPGEDARTFNGSTWSTATIADPYDDGDLEHVSCATITFCAAVDQDGYATVKNGTTWSYPQKVVDNREDGPQHPLYGVACPAVGFCLAVDSAGNSYTFNGTTWSGATPVGADIGLECVSRTFCTAEATSKRAYTFNGTTWKSGPKLPAAGLAPLVCASATFCIGFGGNGPYWVRSWNGKTWSAQHPLGQFSVDQVACATPTDCTAASVNQVIYWNGKTWSAPKPLSTTLGPAMSCVGSGVCIASTVQGIVHLTNGVEGTVTYIDPLHDEAEALSCLTARSCVAVTRFGNIFTSS